VLHGHRERKPADLAVVRRMFDETLSAFGHVDIVINSAGVIIKKPFVFS
jgi:NAD(P)-dependent dehydrogenase (short-subunit alcohol dehydrogenase family)